MCAVTNRPDARAVAATSLCPGDPLDLGIARWVQILRDAGVETYESCEGGEGHAYAVPSVRFYGTPAAGWRALATCQDHGLPVRHLQRCWDLEDGEPAGPYWQIEFRRADV